MLFTIFCCISTGLAVYCIINRVNRRSVDIAVRLAVREVEKELQGRNATMVAQLSAKEGELKRLRELVKVHEAVPTQPKPATPARPATAKTAATPAARSTGDKPQREAADVFAMSRPFTDTSYDALLAVSDVVKVEPAAM